MRATLVKFKHESQDLWILRSDWLELGSSVQSGSTDRAHCYQKHYITMPRTGGSLTSLTDHLKCGSGPSLTHSSASQVNESHPAASTSVQSARQPIISPERAQIRSSVLLAHLTGYSSSEDEDHSIESGPQDIAPRSHPGHTQERLSHHQHTPKRPRPAKPSSKTFKSAEFVTSESERKANTVARHPTATANRATIASPAKSARSSKSRGDLSLSASTSSRLKRKSSSNGPNPTGGSPRSVETTMKRQPISSNTPMGTSKRVKTRGGFVDDSDNSDSGSELSEQRDPKFSKIVGHEGRQEAEDGGDKDNWDSVPPSPPPPKRLPLDGRTVASSSVPLPAKGVNVSRLRMLLGRKEKIPVANRNSLPNIIRSQAATHAKNGLKSVPAPAAKFLQPRTGTPSSTQSNPPSAQRETTKQSSLASSANPLSGGSLLGPKKSTPSTPWSSPAPATASDAVPTTAPTSTRLTDINRHSQSSARPAEARVLNAAKLGTLQTPQKKPSQASSGKQGPMRPIGSNGRHIAPPKCYAPSVTKIPSNAGVVNDLIHSIREGDQQLVNEESHSSAATTKPSDSHGAERTQKRKAEGITGESKGNFASAKKTRTVQTQQTSKSPTSKTQGKSVGDLESSKVPLQPTTATTSEKALIQNTAPEATLTCVADLIDPAPQDLLQPSAVRVEKTTPAPGIPEESSSRGHERSISAPSKADRIVVHEPASTVAAFSAPSSEPTTEPTSVASPISPTTMARKGGTNDGSTNAAAPVAHKRKLSVKEVFRRETAGSVPSKLRISERDQGTQADVRILSISPTPNRGKARSGPSKVIVSEQNQGTEAINREDADVITLSISPRHKRDAEPFFEYAVFQKIWSDEQEEKDAATSEMTTHPFTCLEEANVRAEELFKYTREQFQQHLQARFDQVNSKRDDHDCSVLLGVFAPISYASKKSHLKIWVQRDYVSALANQTPRSLKLTSFVSFVSKTIYVLRLFKLIEPVPESDTEGSNEMIPTVRVYQSVPCTEAYTTLEAANHAAWGLEIELSHEKNPKECMRAWYEKERQRLNNKLDELTGHASEEVEEGRWKSKFNGCDLFKGDKFELMVENVGLCGPRNL